MDRCPRGPHLRGHGALVHPFFLHQVIQFKGNGALERGGVHLLVKPVFLEKVFKAASAMFVLIPWRF